MKVLFKLFWYMIYALVLGYLYFNYVKPVCVKMKPYVNKLYPDDDERLDTKYEPKEVDDVGLGYVKPIKHVSLPIPEGNVSVYVPYGTATHSNSADEYGLDNTPTDEQLRNIRYIAQNLFDPVYEYMLKKYGVKITINSFYRTPEVDYKVQQHSVSTGQIKVAKYGNSQHTRGQAIDISAGKYMTELFYYIKNNMQYDQLLWEFGTDNRPKWVHVSLIANRQESAQTKPKGVFIPIK